MSEQIGPRQFNIGQRPSAAEITALATKPAGEGKTRMHFMNYAVQEPIARAMIDNMTDFQAGVPVGEIMNLISVQVNDGGSRRKIVRGKEAIINSFAGSLGSMVSTVEWNMDSPQMVYMSGAYFSFVLSTTVDGLNRHLQQIVDGEVIFPDDEAKTTAIANNETAKAKWLTFRSRIETTLEEYAQQNGLTEDYPRVLQELLFLSHRNPAVSSTIRTRIFDAMKENRIDDASKLLGIKNKE